MAKSIDDRSEEPPIDEGPRGVGFGKADSLTALKTKYDSIEIGSFSSGHGEREKYVKYAIRHSRHPRAQKLKRFDYL